MTPERLLATMTLADKAAQLFVLHLHGDTAHRPHPGNRAAHGVDTPAEVIARHRPGGVVYFAGNLRAPAQTAALSNALHRSALDNGAAPLLIATDQEGGLITRLPPPATQTPGAMALAATRDPATARSLARLTARELRALGITQTYAPVADVNARATNPVIGVRSFGSDPHLAAAMTAAHIQGLRDGGAASTAKHFPGHGDTTVDSHTGVPVITHTRRQWERADLPPLRAALDAGADAVMTGHLVVPALDPSGLPATLSHRIVTGLLRTELGYDGVIVTDALDMRGVRTRLDDAHVAVAALKAGVDMLLKPPAGAFPAQLRAILDAVGSGDLTEERLTASALRVLRLKHRLGLLDDPFTGPDPQVGTPPHQAEAQRAAAHAVTLLTDRDHLLPLTPGTGRVLVTGRNPALLADALTGHGLTVTLDPAHDHQVTVALTDRAWNDPAQIALVTALHDQGTPLIVVAVGDPYDIAHFPQVSTYLATYSRTPPSLKAAAATLTGHNPPRGRLPVTIPTTTGETLYPFGHGLDG